MRRRLRAGVEWIVARGDGHIRDHRFNNLIINADRLNHAIFDNPRNGIGHSLIRTNRHPDISVNKIRISVREEYHRRLAYARKDDRKDQQSNNTQRHTDWSVTRQTPCQYLFVTALNFWPCGVLEGLDN